MPSGDVPRWGPRLFDHGWFGQELETLAILVSLDARTRAVAARELPVYAMRGMGVIGLVWMACVGEICNS